MERIQQTSATRPVLLVNQPEMKPVPVFQVIPTVQKPVNNLPFIESNTKEVEISHITDVNHSVEVDVIRNPQCKDILIQPPIAIREP